MKKIRALALDIVHWGMIRSDGNSSFYKVTHGQGIDDYGNSGLMS